MARQIKRRLRTQTDDPPVRQEPVTTDEFVATVLAWGQLCSVYANFGGKLDADTQDYVRRVRNQLEGQIKDMVPRG